MNFTEKIKYLMEEYPNAEIKVILYDVDGYTTGNIKDVYFDKLTLYHSDWNGTNEWLNKVDCEEAVYDDISEEYYDQTDKFIDEKVQEILSELNFKEFICVIVGY